MIVFESPNGFLEIKPRNIGLSMQMNDSGYQLITFVGTGDNRTFVANTGGRYKNYPVEWSENARQVLSQIVFTGDHVYTLDLDNQFYNHSIPEANRTYSSGQSMTYFDGTGTCKMCAFLKTEYISGEPVTKAYIGGLFDFMPPDVTTYIGTYATVRRTYETDRKPKIAFDIITIINGADKYPCLAVSILDESSELSRFTTKLIDLRMISDSVIPESEIDRNTTTPYGRTGTYNFTSDQMIDVAPTGYSFVNRWAHGLTLYHINDLQAEAIFAEFWGNETLWQMFLNSTVKQIQGVLCMHKVPVPVASGSSTRPLSIFGKRVARGELLEQLPLVNSQIVQYPESPQWVSIAEIYGDYFDYAGQTRFSVYLPFVGTVPIDVNKIMGGAIKTVYHVDLLTGNLIARVYGRNSMNNGAEVLLYQGSGNCALHIPYIGNDQGGMKLLGALAGVATAGLATVATGGAASAPALAAISGTAGYALAPHNASVNNVPTEAAPLSYPYVCYIMEYPERLLTALQGTQTGFATASGGANTTVSNYSGYTQGFLHADIAGATEAEKAEIERAFENGVIL